MTPYATAQQAYRDSSVLTAPPERLVVMLYDGAHRFLFQAAHAMRSGDISQTNNRMQRAEAIISELRGTLNHEKGGEVAGRLEAIYDFCQRHLLEARLKKDPQRIEQVMKLLGELRDAWEQVANRS
jgi:flagellar secretion chaperone FliS